MTTIRQGGWRLAGVLLLAALVLGGGAGRVAAGPPRAAVPNVGGIQALALDATGNGWAWAYSLGEDNTPNYLIRIENGNWNIALDSTTAPDILPLQSYINQIVITPSGEDGWAIGGTFNGDTVTPLFLRYKNGAWSVRKTSFTPAIGIIDITVTPDGLDGWMTVWDSNREIYRLLRYQKGGWDYVAGPDGGTLQRVALSPDGKTGWAVGPSTTTDQQYAAHTAYRLRGARWERVPGELYNPSFFPYQLVADNTGNGWVLATFAPDDFHSLSQPRQGRPAPARDEIYSRELLYRLHNEGAPQEIALSVQAPAANPDADYTLSSLTVDGTGRGLLVGSIGIGPADDPTRTAYNYLPLFWRIQGDALTPLDGSAVGLSAPLTSSPSILVTSPEGAHTWLGLYNEDSTGTLQPLTDPWPHATPALATPLPGAGQCFAQVPACLRGVFAKYWTAHGGLDGLGYPLTPEVQEKQGDKTYTVQYTQRARLEYHPEYAGTPNEVLLGLLGNTLADPRRAETPFVAVPDPPLASVVYFKETGHVLAPPFLAYWQSKGGLAVFGLPRSEAFSERNSADGKLYKVQYFERNRLEYHPENAGTKFEYLLGLLGVEQFSAQYGFTP